jgi:hypothetical protein
MKSNLMREIRASLAAPAAQPPTPIRPAAPQRPAVPWLAYLSAAACLVVALLSTFQLTNLRGQHERDTQQLTLLQARVDQQEHSSNEARAQLALTQSQIADLLAPNAERYPVQQGLVARSNGRIILALQRLATPPKGKVYQAWVLRKGAKTVAPSITFSPDASGLALVELPGSAADLVAVAVSVEPTGGSKAPTSTPAFVRPLS